MLPNDGQAEENTMRCPICRETIIVPRGGGGAATFPPAFIVNQLLDLMASQRHPGQELLFCEICDVIFSPDCRGDNTRWSQLLGVSLGPCRVAGSSYAPLGDRAIGTGLLRGSMPISTPSPDCAGRLAMTSGTYRRHMH
ncbi:unnamed protein product [Rodentolepis nana]|uniref:LITAF domain-containing protein n=1 Tax=Rodentolepis nana TaxID=102285 RepID=A0A0R3TJK5_RODNA|nr:unnamed protein product [Rodentolepis nana]